MDGPSSLLFVSLCRKRDASLYMPTPKKLIRVVVVQLGWTEHVQVFGHLFCHRSVVPDRHHSVTQIVQLAP